MGKFLGALCVVPAVMFLAFIGSYAGPIFIGIAMVGFFVWLAIILTE